MWTDAIRIGNGIRVYWYLWFCRDFLWMWNSQWNLETRINGYHDSYPQDGWFSTSTSCLKRIWYVLKLSIFETHKKVTWWDIALVFVCFCLGNSQARRLLPPWLSCEKILLTAPLAWQWKMVCYDLFPILPLHVSCLWISLIWIDMVYIY